MPAPFRISHSGRPAAPIATRLGRTNPSCGNGGLYRAGRWHSLGTVANLSDGLVAALDPGLWPSGRGEDAHADAARAPGDEWVRSRSSLGLIAPSSAGAPPSFNAPISPDHPDVGEIEIERTTPFVFNARPGA